MKPTFLMMSILFLLGCQNRDFSEQIKTVTVGMTYEEVEKILGKPNDINRGFRKIKVITRNAAISSLRDLMSRDDAEQVSAITFEFVTHYPDTVSIEIEEGGELTSVRWGYAKAIMKIDTLIVKDIPRIVCDTSRVQGVKYYCQFGEKQEMTKAEFDELYPTLNRMRESEYGSERLDEMKAKGTPINIWSETGEILEFSNYRIEPQSKMYLVTYKQSVLFDASSGRVTSAGFEPLLISAQTR